MRRKTLVRFWLSSLIALLLTLSFASLGLQTAYAEADTWAWTSMSSGTSVTLFSVWGASSTDVFAVGEGGCILHFDGNKWSLMNSGSTEVLHGVWGTGPSDVFAVGAHGTILHYDGTNWSTSPGSPLSFNIADVWGSSPTDFYVVGEEHIGHFNGSTWECVHSGASKYDLMDVWGCSNSDIYAVGKGATKIVDCPSDPSWGPCITMEEAGPVLHYDGITWQDLGSVVRLVTPVPFLGVWGSSCSDVFFVGLDVLHFDGGNWQLSPGYIENYYMGASLYGVSGISQSDVYAVGSGWGSATGGAVFHYDGSLWTPINTGTIEEGLRGVWCDSTSDVFAVGYSGTILYHGTGLTPQIQTFSTTASSQGETLDITITGRRFSGVDSVSLGDGITVNSITVNSDSWMMINVTVDSKATPGDRDVSVAAPWGAATLANGFKVKEQPLGGLAIWVAIGTGVVLLASIACFAVVQRRPTQS